MTQQGPCCFPACGAAATDGSEARAVQFTQDEAGTYFSFAKKTSAVLN